MTRVILFGTPEYAKEVLKTIDNMDDIAVVAVVSQPNKAIGRSHSKLVVTPTAKYAEENNIKLFQPVKPIEIITELIDLKADIVITAAYGKIIPEAMLESIANHKWFNMHASLLPAYRGGAPIQYSIMNGDDKTGVTLMEMEKGMDTGDMISKSYVDITEDDNLETLTTKLQLSAAQLLKSNISSLANGKYEKEKQDESLVSFAWNITQKDCEIDWNNSAYSIKNKVRAVYPKMQAFTKLGDEKLKITKVEIVSSVTDAPNIQPGEIFTTKKFMFVKTSDAWIKVLEVIPSGKKKMDASSYLNGKRNIISEIGKFN